MYVNLIFLAYFIIIAVRRSRLEPDGYCGSRAWASLR